MPPTDETSSPKQTTASRLGGVPLVGGLMRQIEEQTALIVSTVEAQAKVLSALPTTIRLMNDSMVAFSSAVQRMDRVVRRVEALTKPLDDLDRLMPRLETMTRMLDKPIFGEVPEMLERLRALGMPAFTELASSQQQIAVVAASIERWMQALDETLRPLANLPGMGRMTRLTGSGKAEPRA